MINVLRPNTTSRVDLTTGQGIKCIHYGDIYKVYDNRVVKSSLIINSFIKDVNLTKIIQSDSIVFPDVTETINDFGHFVYVEYDGTPYINGTHTFALTGESSLLKYLFYNFQSKSTRQLLQQLLKGDTVFQLSYKEIVNFNPPKFHKSIIDQQHIVDIRRIR